MGDTDQAQGADFEYAIASILTHKDIDPQRRDSALNLNVQPYQVLSVQEHQRDELLIDVLWEGLKTQPGNVGLHEAKELVQHFSLHSYHLTAVQKMTL